ncbi:carbon-phosphorus lyase complex subunit PhnI [Escherichia coli]|uniref:carbon-phosphorus lyase complex subunit PhnI n=1 Tax=Escherichia coli TaxID=562 RepID=UPI0038560D45
MYVAVKGGEKAIDAAHALQESRRRGDTDLPELSVAQIEQQLNLAVDRVMTEGGIADRELAALALKQASGDNVEAIILLRAYRTTLAKLAVSEPLDTTGMRLERRISAVYKDIPGGQLLGPTYDYTHRLLDFTLLANGEAPTLTTADSEQQPSPHVFSLLARQGLAKFEEDSGAQPDDITRTPPVYPCSRSSRLQQLMRGDEGYLLALAYSTQRGYGRNHPFAGEIRSGYIDVSIVPEELGFAVNVGELLMTECEMVNGFIDPPGEPPHFTRGYGLVFGMSERKAMAMATGARHYGDIRATAQKWLEEVEIPANRIDDLPTTFSGGMQQRLQIARNLVTHPKLVFMDEPTGGLDVSVQARLLDLLRGLVVELNLAVVIVTHDLGVARLLADRLLVMKQGQVVESGLTDRVLDDPHHPYTQLLVSSVLQN